MIKRTRPLSAGLQQGAILIAAVSFAYGLDYLFNLVAGRLLAPAEFGVFVALTGVGQVLVVASRVIQTVVTRYVARFHVQPDGDGRIASFFRAMLRSAWRWGTAAMVVMLLLAYPLARFLQIDQMGPVLALAAATLLLVVRPVVGGVMQGGQQFAALGAVQVVQALLRLGLGAVLMLAGLGAFGAMAALPVASAAALIVGLALLNKVIRRPIEVHHGVSVPDLFRYSAYTAAGLIGYALLVNMDAILVKRFFAPDVAGHYSAAVTLGKVIQFFPVAIIIILFPKAAQRKASQRDPAEVLLPSLVLVALLCSGITLAYGLFADSIVRLTVGEAYQVDGLLLGLVGIAMSLFSLVNVWLNYFLSTEQPRFVYLVGIGILLQVVMMALFHDELWYLPAIMALNGLWLTLAGGFIFWKTRRNTQYAIRNT